MSRIKCKEWSPRRGPFRFAQVKRDGMWLELYHSDGELVAMTSRPLRLHEQLKHLDWYHRIAQKMDKNSAFSLLGELYVPGAKRSQVKRSLANQLDDLAFECFAVRGALSSLGMEETEELAKELGAAFVPWTDLEQPGVPKADRYDIRGDSEGDPEQLRTIWFGDKPDVEGLVFKNGNLLDWHKWKPVRTIDVVVTGWKRGTPLTKNQDKLGALLCSVMTLDGDVVEVASASGMEDDVRDEMTAMLKDDSLVGRVCELRYQNVGDGGRLVHPAFLHWREDKTRAQCLVDQDQELLDYYHPQGDSDEGDG